MADSAGSASGSPLLRGLFGVLQAGAAQRLDTSTIWSNLRQAVGTWQAQAQGLPQPYDPDAIDAAGRSILGAQGINGATVSTFRGIAGSWLGAKNNLHALGPFEQITAPAVFTAPWARTANPAVPSRYRLRTQWQVESAAGEQFTITKSDEIDGPLTTTADLFGAAAPTPDTTSGQAILASASPSQLLDYELEMV